MFALGSRENPGHILSGSGWWSSPPFLALECEAVAHRALFARVIIDINLLQELPEHIFVAAGLYFVLQNVIPG